MKFLRNIRRMYAAVTHFAFARVDTPDGHLRPRLRVGILSGLICYTIVMPRKMPLIFLLVVIAVIATLHIVGIRFYLYWQLSWYDRIVHVLAGFWVALTVLSSIGLKAQALKRGHIFSIGLIAAIIIGIVWEIFEVKVGVTAVTDKGYWADTAGDIISDIVGGLLGSWYYHWREQSLIWKNNQNV